MDRRRGGKSGPETMKERALSLGNRVSHEIGLHRQALRRTLATPEGQEASVAARRTVINIAISAVDVVPLLGDIPSWVADGIKIVVRMRKSLDRLGRRAKEVPIVGGPLGAVFQHTVGRIASIDRYDLTPDVSLRVALGTELIELLSLAAPTHAIESTMQLWHDLPRFKRGFSRYRRFLREERQPKLPVTPVGWHPLLTGGDIDSDDVIDIIPRGDK